MALTRTRFRVVVEVSSFSSASSTSLRRAVICTRGKGSQQILVVGAGAAQGEQRTSFFLFSWASNTLA